MSAFKDGSEDIASQAAWTSVAVKLLWLCIVVGPITLFSSFLGHPVTVLKALERVSLPAEKENAAFPGDKSERFNILEIAAAVVVSPDAIWVYDMGPDIGIGLTAEYPGEMFFMTLDEGRLRDAEVVGQHVPALASHLDARRKTLIGLLGEDAEHRVVFAVDEAVPFETVRALMFTAGQARHHDARIVVQGEDGPRVRAAQATIGLREDACAANQTQPELVTSGDDIWASGHLTRETLRALGVQ